MKVVEENFRQLLKKVLCLWRKQMFVYIDEDFAINRIRPNFLSLLMTGIIRIGVAERGSFKKYSETMHIPTGGKPRNYHEIVLTQICSQATSGTRRGSFQAENWIKKGWCHVHFCFILQLRTNNGEIRQCSSA